jgi:membrane protein
VASVALVTAAAVKSLGRHHAIEARPAPAPAAAPVEKSQLRLQAHVPDNSLGGRLERRLPWLHIPLAVKRRYAEVVAGSGPDLGARIVHQLGLSGDAARSVTDALHAAESSRKAASVLGLVGLLWSGLGLVGALQYAFNGVWQVNERGLKDKAVGLFWLAGASLLFVISAALTTALRWLPGFLAPVGILVTFGLSFGLWLWTSKVLPNRDVPWRRLVPGALLGAAGLEVLKFVGSYLVPRMVASSSQLYGSLGIVFAVLAWLLIFGRLVVYSAALNVVLYEDKEGTVTALVEVPPLPGVSTGPLCPLGDTPPPEANRSGRLISTK